MAAEFGGTCNLRFDDTNPTKEDVEYVESIQEDVRWLGFDWDGELLYASDYFEPLYGYAVHLIKAGKAYVDSLSAEEIREYRGTLTEPGRDSPYRDRPSKRTSTCSRACAPASSRTARTCCGQRSTWRRPTSTCATRCSTASGTRTITAPAMPGASIRCTTSRIRRRMRSSGSPTRSARSSSRITGRSTTG